MVVTETPLSPTPPSDKAVGLPDLAAAEALCNDLKHILVRSGTALTNGNARETVEKIERWIESYRRGLSAAQKISDNGPEMLKKARDQLSLSLEELLRLEDEGGNPPSPAQHNDSEELTRAIRRIDSLMPVMEHSFQAASSTPETV